MAIPPEPSAVHNDAPPTDRQPSYKLSHSLSGHTRSVTALRFSNDGKFLVSAGADGYVHIWDATTGSHIREIRCHHRGINDLSLSPDSLYLATCSDDSTCSIHLLSPSSSSNSSPATNTPLRVLEAHTAPVLACSFSPKSSLLVSGSFDESAMIWDIRKGKVLRRLPAHAEAVWTVGWDWEGGMVVTGSSDGLIRLWDANTGQCLKTLDNESNSPVSYAAFTPSSFFLLSSTLSSTIRLSNFHTAKVLKTLRAPGIYVNEKYPCHAVVYQALPRGTEAIETSDRGRRKKKLEAWVMTGSENGKLLVWDLQSRTVLQVLEGGHENAVTAVAVSSFDEDVEGMKS
ncbi:COMPASS component SWD3, partial [Tremellales sp. Uapishka_1]